jgi:hypothetical protein
MSIKLERNGLTAAVAKHRISSTFIKYVPPIGLNDGRKKENKNENSSFGFRGVNGFYLGIGFNFIRTNSE